MNNKDKKILEVTPSSMTQMVELLLTKINELEDKVNNAPVAAKTNTVEKTKSPTKKK